MWVQYNEPIAASKSSHIPCLTLSQSSNPTLCNIEIGNPFAVTASHSALPFLTLNDKHYTQAAAICAYQ